jgi:hypothetical protein
MLIVTTEAYSRLSAKTKAELLNAVFHAAIPDSNSSEEPFDPKDFSWDGVVDFSPGEIEEFMATLSNETKDGLKVIAERGPVVRAAWLNSSGIESYASFQRSTTRRTRSLTGGKNDFLLTWDDWNNKEEGEGCYAVSAATHRALRIFFDLI